jgi:hypothetical protein
MRKFFEIQPDVSNLRVFGCAAQVHVPTHKRESKFERVTEDGILVGYALYSKAWRVLVDTERGLIVRESSHVVFDETRTYKKICDVLREFPDADVKPAEGAQYTDFSVPRSSKRGPEPDEYVPEQEEGSELAIVPEQAPAAATSSSGVTSILGGPDRSVEQDEEAESRERSAAVESEQVSEPSAEAGGGHGTLVSGYEDVGSRRYPARNRKAVNQPYDAYLFLTVERKPPLSLAQAKASPEWPLWRGAINAELRSLYEKSVYVDVSLEDVPEGKEPIPGKWVFDYKTDALDAVVGHKARFVGKVSIKLSGWTTTKLPLPPSMMQLFACCYIMLLSGNCLSTKLM